MTVRELLNGYVDPSDEVILVFPCNGREISNQCEEHLFFLKDRLLDQKVDFIYADDGVLRVGVKNI